MKKKRSPRQRKVEVVLPTGETITTSSNIQAGDIVWYPAKKASFVETTIKYLKGWFRA